MHIHVCAASGNAQLGQCRRGPKADKHAGLEPRLVCRAIKFSDAPMLVTLEILFTCKTEAETILTGKLRQTVNQLYHLRQLYCATMISVHSFCIYVFLPKVQRYSSECLQMNDPLAMTEHGFLCHDDKQPSRYKSPHVL